MNMKKKYIQYRSGLLIGLLSLNILSSCVHTNRTLNMGGRNGTSNKDVEKGGNSSKNEPGWKAKAGYGILTLGVATASATAGYSFGKNKGYDQGRADGSSNRCNESSNNSNNPKLGKWPSKGP